MALRALRIGQKINAVVFLMTAALAIMAGGSLWLQHSTLMEARQDKVRAVVEAAMSLLQAHYRLVEEGRMPLAEAQTHALADLSRLRYDGDNYVWINDRRPVLLMHPIRTDLQGQHVGGFLDASGRALFAEFIALADSGGGFAVYDWPRPGGDEPERKVSYVAPFAPWGWVVGSGLYVGDVEHLFLRRAGQFSLFVGAITGAALLLSMAVARSITRPLSEVTVLTRRLSQGDTAIEVPVIRGRDEVAELTEALAVFKDNACRMDGLRQAREEEQRRAAEALRASEERVRLLLESAGEGIYGLDTGGVCNILNPAAVRMLGFDSPDQLLGRKIHDIIHHHRADGSAYPPGECHIHACIVSGEVAHVDDEVYFRADGSSFPVEYRAHPIRRDGTIIGAVVSFTDITERRRAEERMRVAQTVFETTTDGIMVTDAANNITSVNPAFSRVTGYAAEEVVGRDPGLLSSGRHDRAFYDALWQDLIQHGHWQGELWNQRKDGSLYAEWLTITAIRNASGVPLQFVAVFSDITTRAHAAEQTRHEANFDPLTELPNRRYFSRILDRMLATSATQGRQVGLLFVDLDRFKPVNDTLGHTIGDHLLVEVAVRLKACVRNSDSLARLGGDEFLVALDGITSPAICSMVARKIIESLSQPFDIGGHRIQIGASIGVTMSPLGGTDSKTLIDRADAAMYNAKAAGRSCYEVLEFDATAL